MPKTQPSTARISLAAVLCALDAENDEAIAARLGISRRTLVRWKKRPEFVAARDEFAERIGDEIRRVRLERAIAWAESLPSRRSRKSRGSR